VQRASTMKLREIGEFGFIDRIAPLGIMRSEGVIKGIGDDCAVIDVGGPQYLLVTTDLMVERVHVHLNWARPEIIGAKALTTNLSDIAACGGIPREAFISLAIPERIDVEWLEGLYQGMADLARGYEVNLLGGDTTVSKSDLVINLAVSGLVPREEVLFRHTAKAGNVIVLTGPVGESGAGCHALLTAPHLPASVADHLVRAHLEPRAHVREGRLLAQSGGCTAAIDVSDGLSSDLWHLCHDSEIGALVYEERIPIGPEIAQAADALGQDPLKWVLDGGEDYVLLAAVRPEMVRTLGEIFTRAGCQFFPIGEFVPGRSMEILRRDGTRQNLLPGGWDHFR
jgi:thiamine-monophosphate kinase